MKDEEKIAVMFADDTIQADPYPELTADEIEKDKTLFAKIEEKFFKSSSSSKRVLKSTSRMVG